MINDPEIEAIKKEIWNNKIPKSKDFRVSSNTKFEHARLWTDKLLIASIVLICISAFFIIASFVVYLKKPVPFVFSSNKYGEIILLNGGK